jgi:hypothetical protein
MQTPVPEPAPAHQYPIGPWTSQDHYTPAEIDTLIGQLTQLPAQYRQLTETLPDADLARTYRPGSWTVRQLVHHVADTHEWHLIRVKHVLTLPEKTTALIGNVNAWAMLADSVSAPVGPSLAVLEAVHLRWAYLSQSLQPADFERAYYHPLRQRDITLAQALHVGVWHAEHHLAHIRLALSL